MRRSWILLVYAVYKRIYCGVQINCRIFRTCAHNNRKARTRCISAVKVRLHDSARIIHVKGRRKWILLRNTHASWGGLNYVILSQTRSFSPSFCTCLSFSPLLFSSAATRSPSKSHTSTTPESALRVYFAFSHLLGLRNLHLRRWRTGNTLMNILEGNLVFT